MDEVVATAKLCSIKIALHEFQQRDNHRERELAAIEFIQECERILRDYPEPAPELIDDQPLTDIPAECLDFKVVEGGSCGGRVTKNEKGFHVCSRCGVSYGRG